MKLHAIGLAIIVACFATVILIGLWVSRRGSKDLDGYFLGGKSLRWYLLGISDASGMFDISGGSAAEEFFDPPHQSFSGFVCRRRWLDFDALRFQ